jgi:glycine hydroxymethyltransferase
MKRGFKLVTNGTDNHLILCDIKTSFGIHGGVAEEALDAIGLTMNKNSIPNDPEPPFRPSGIRLGTPAMTTRGLTEEHMEQVAEWMLLGIQHRSDAKKVAALQAEIKKFALQFPLPSDM